MVFFALLFVLVVVGIGFLGFLIHRDRIEEERRFVDQYIKNLQRFVEHYRTKFDPDLYYWLNHRVLHLQSLMNSPHQWEFYGFHVGEDARRRSETLIGIIDEMGQGSVPEKKTTAMMAFLFRFLGTLDDRLERFQDQKKNPLILFREGIQIILLSPLLALRWATGADTRDYVEATRRKRGFRRLTALASIGGIVVPLLIVVVGWDNLVGIGSSGVSATGSFFRQVIVFSRDVLSGLR